MSTTPQAPSAFRDVTQPHNREPEQHGDPARGGEGSHPETMSTTPPQPSGPVPPEQLEESGQHWVLCGGLHVGRTVQPRVWRLRPKDEVVREKQRAEDLQQLACETRRAEQLALNSRWLMSQIDRIHKALCPGKAGTWQQLAEQSVAAAERTPTVMEEYRKVLQELIDDHVDLVGADQACDCRPEPENQYVCSWCRARALVNSNS
jgi:hypothetical protein